MICRSILLVNEILWMTLAHWRTLSESFWISLFLYLFLFQWLLSKAAIFCFIRFKFAIMRSMTALSFCMLLALASSIITLSGLASMQAYCYDNESKIGPELSVSVRTSNQTSCQTFFFAHRGRSRRQTDHYFSPLILQTVYATTTRSRLASCSNMLRWSWYVVSLQKFALLLSYHLCF